MAFGSSFVIAFGISVFQALACGGPTTAGRAADIPVSEVRIADTPRPPPPKVEAAAASQCPEGFVWGKKEGQCLRVIHAGGAPHWKPPSGDPARYDPCGAWSDPVGLVNCDPENEHQK